eukprot:scaffold22305_cov23-Cyclotella_meneghiniana.AAC.1
MADNDPPFSITYVNKDGENITLTGPSSRRFDTTIFLRPHPGTILLRIKIIGLHKNAKPKTINRRNGFNYDLCTHLLPQENIIRVQWMVHLKKYPNRVFLRVKSDNFDTSILGVEQDVNFAENNFKVIIEQLAPQPGVSIENQTAPLQMGEPIIQQPGVSIENQTAPLQMGEPIIQQPIIQQPIIQQSIASAQPAEPVEQQTITISPPQPKQTISPQEHKQTTIVKQSNSSSHQPRLSLDQTFDLIAKSVQNMRVREDDQDVTSEGSFGESNDYTPNHNESPGITYENYNDYVSAKRKHNNEYLINTGLLEAKEDLKTSKPPPKKKSHCDMPKSITTTRTSPRINQQVETYMVKYEKYCSLSQDEKIDSSLPLPQDVKANPPVDLSKLIETLDSKISQIRESLPSNAFCEVCKNQDVGGTVVACDGCEKCYHHNCLDDGFCGDQDDGDWLGPCCAPPDDGYDDGQDDGYDDGVGDDGADDDGA